MKIKAAVLNKMGVQPPYATSKPLAIEEFELDDPGYGEVMVKIGAAGLCHSDLSVIDGNRPRPTPMVLGHEAAGTVERLGPGIDDLKVGDHVVMVFVPSCGHCVPCAEGRPALCEPGAVANGAGSLLSGARRLHRHGADVHHHLGCSAFAEYATVSRRSLVKIDEDLPLDEAALFGCAVLTGVGAVINTAKLVGEPEEDYATRELQAKNSDRLDKLLAQWISERTVDECITVMKDIGVVASPIYAMEDIVADPTFKERESIAEVPVEGLGKVRMQNVFPKLQNYRGSIWRSAPKLGEDNELVYREFIGKDNAEIARLRSEGHI